MDKSDDEKRSEEDDVDEFLVDVEDEAVRNHVLSTLKKANRKLKKTVERRKSELSHNIVKVVKKLRTSKTARFMHKVCFIFVVFDIGLSSFWLGRYPSTYHNIHTLKFALLMLIRFSIFRWRRHHYYLFDYCYYANITFLCYLYGGPKTQFLEPVLRGSSVLLGIAIPIFRNSLVFHSIDQITSAELHFSPLLVIWSRRWYGKETTYTGLLQSYKELFSLSEGGMIIVMYSLWAISYHLKLTRESVKIRERKYVTMYYHLAHERGLRRRLPPSLQPVSYIVYIIGHATFFLFGLMLTPFIYHSYRTNTIFIFTAFLCLTYNGANFYMEYFGRNYERQLEMLEVADLSST